jgi:hypothetical protein
MKGIYVLNIIIQNILEKIGCEAKGSQRNAQNLNTPNMGTKTRWGENPKGNSKGN